LVSTTAHQAVAELGTNCWRMAPPSVVVGAGAVEVVVLMELLGPVLLEVVEVARSLHDARTREASSATRPHCHHPRPRRRAARETSWEEAITHLDVGEDTYVARRETETRNGVDRAVRHVPRLARLERLRCD
jgi:hypothetical protein